MDEAVLRRGAVSANARWTNSIAILTGDFLFARASEITADLGTEATRILAQTIAVLCEGQIRETVGPGSGDPIAHYRQVVAEKTGSLIATSGRLGALLSGASPAVVAALTAVGDRIGVAFQLSDDLLDITSPSGESGKNPGTDLREGVRTLPVLLRRAGRAGRCPTTCPTTACSPARLQTLRGSAGDRTGSRGTRSPRPPPPGRSSPACRTCRPAAPSRALCDYVVTRTG